MIQVLTKSDYAPFFVPANIGKSQTVTLFDGRYTLTIESYNTCEPTDDHKTWPFTRGLIRDIAGEIIFDIHRNYHVFMYVPFTFNKCDYLVVGPAYMEGYLVNLTRHTAILITKDQFCFSEGSANPDGSIIDMVGCYWGANYEHRFYRVVSTKAGDTLDEIFAPFSIDFWEKEVDSGEDYQQRIEWFQDDDKKMCLRVINFQRYYIGLADGDLHHSNSRSYFDKLLTEKRTNEDTDPNQEGMYQSMDVFTFQANHESEMRAEEIITLRLSSGGNCFQELDHWQSYALILREIKYCKSRLVDKSCHDCWVESNPYVAKLTQVYPNQDCHMQYGDMGFEYHEYYTYHLPSHLKYDRVLMSMFSHNTRMKFRSTIEKLFRSGQDETRELLTERMKCFVSHFNEEPGHFLLSYYDENGKRVYDRVEIGTPEELMIILSQ